MNKLNKKIISFVLLFSICLLVNVSYAFEKDVSIVLGDGSYDLDYESKIGDSLVSDITPDLYNKYLNPNDPEIDAIFNERIEFIFNELGFNSYFMYGYTNADGNDYFSASFFNDTSINFGFYDNAGKRIFCLEASNNSQLYRLNKSTNGGFVSSAYVYTYNTNSKYYNRLTPQSLAYFITSPNLKVHNLVYSSEDNIYWDGTYYSTSSEEEPTMPTNAEISQAVQAFYNSDYYKNNKDFKEFFVLYNSLKGIYSFIGHNSVGEIAGHFKYGSTLSQHIYTENYPSNTTGLRYWNFSLETLGSQISNVFNNYYWLYSSHDNGISFAYNGKGYVTDLIDVKFDSRYSTIVYSSIDYLCRIYDYENDEETTEDATISGDQYTYDENLDPTTNEYNPIENFVPVNPSQSILGDVDFNEINKTFEENKDILNIENASWLFTANNKLVGYFIGFLSLLIVFLIISRILGG